MARSYPEWIASVDKFMFVWGGVTSWEMPLNDYRSWWKMGYSPNSAARQALSMDNG